jgi:hypothetical protein
MFLGEFTILVMLLKLYSVGCMLHVFIDSHIFYKNNILTSLPYGITIVK